MTHEELVAAGHDIPESAYARIETFVRALLAENRDLNLTAASDEATVWQRHVCDSLMLRSGLGQGVALLDLGSGGGLPGLPLACTREDIRVTLVDATRKKVGAINRMIDAIELDNACAAWQRAEVMAHDAAYREQFDIVTARAVGPVAMLVEYAAGFVRTGGVCWFFKTAAVAEQEIAEAQSAARACALEHVESRAYRLVGDEEDRVLIAYRKTGPLDAKLPRKSGKAKKRPL